MLKTHVQKKETNNKIPAQAVVNQSEMSFGDFL